MFDLFSPQRFAVIHKVRFYMMYSQTVRGMRVIQERIDQIIPGEVTLRSNYRIKGQVEVNEPDQEQHQEDEDEEEDEDKDENDAPRPVTVTATCETAHGAETTCFKFVSVEAIDEFDTELQIYQALTAAGVAGELCPKLESFGVQLDIDEMTRVERLLNGTADYHTDVKETNNRQGLDYLQQQARPDEARTQPANVRMVTVPGNVVKAKLDLAAQLGEDKETKHRSGALLAELFDEYTDAYGNDEGGGDVVEPCTSSLVPKLFLQTQGVAKAAGQPSDQEFHNACEHMERRLLEHNISLRLTSRNFVKDVHGQWLVVDFSNAEFESNE